MHGVLTKQTANAIEVKGLTKRFGGFTAVDKISFDVRDGEIFGLLGPNGAGKTTTISMLSTIISQTSGSAHIYGHDAFTEKDAVRASIGIVFQDPSLDDELTGRENLDLHGRLYGMPDRERKEVIGKVLRLVELEDKAGAQVKGYSGGMKRRLEIARGFMHKPKVLFLDEPTIGLDPQTRRRLWDYIHDLNRKEHVTIILTTHYMEEADALCDRIAIIDHGKIIKLDTPDRLKDSLGGDLVRLGVEKRGRARLIASIRKAKISKRIRETDEGIDITVANGGRSLPGIMDAAKATKVHVDYATVKRPTLEDVFINLTGKQIREEAGAAGGLRGLMLRRR